MVPGHIVSYTASLAALTGRALTILRAGFAHPGVTLVELKHACAR